MVTSGGLRWTGISASDDRAIGSRIENFVPRPGVDSTAADPPLASTIRRTIARPSPVPGIPAARSPRKNGSNACVTSSGVMPTPLSETVSE